jgi:hypothetical protein
MASLGVGTAATATRLVNIASTAGVSPLVAVGPAAYLLVDNVGSGNSYSDNATSFLWSGGGSNLLELTTSSKNLTVHGGNVTFNTAAKGVNFTANTPAAGMTSQLLNWYEEGTWTPTVTAASGTGYTTAVYASRYTRIGRLVTVSATIQVTAAGTASGVMNISGLPFTSAATQIPASICYEGGSGIAYMVHGVASGTTATISTLINTGVNWAYATIYYFTMTYEAA